MIHKFTSNLVIIIIFSLIASYSLPFKVVRALSHLVDIILFEHIKGNYYFVCSFYTGKLDSDLLIEFMNI